MLVNITVPWILWVFLQLLHFVEKSLLDDRASGEQALLENWTNRGKGQVESQVINPYHPCMVYICLHVGRFLW